MFVPIWLVLPSCEATNLGVFDLCHFALLKRAVQIRAGLELADLEIIMPAAFFRSGCSQKPHFFQAASCFAWSGHS